MIYFGRSLEIDNPKLYQWVIDQTAFISLDCKFNERLYCLVNNISDKPICQFSGSLLKFKDFTHGYKTSSFKNAKISVDGVDIFSEDDKKDLREKYEDLLSQNLCYRDFNPTFFKKYPKLTKRVIAATNNYPGKLYLNQKIFIIINDIEYSPDRVFTKTTDGKIEYNLRVMFSYREEALKFANMVGSSDYVHGVKVKDFIIRNKNNNALLY